jgi:hypothetical protein
LEGQQLDFEGEVVGSLEAVSAFVVHIGFRTVSTRW